MKTLTTAFVAVALLLVACGPAQAALVIAEDLMVDLDSQALPPGVLLSWTNTGSLVGNFNGLGDPTVENVGGVNAVTFDGDGDYFEGPVTVPGIEADGTRSIEVWAYNPVDPPMLGEETLLTWGHRGGPDGSNMSFNYGTDGRWGAVGHWGGGTFDMGWGGNNNANPDPATPAAGQWHHLVYTYDGAVARVYQDGRFSNDRAVGALVTHAGDPIRIAAQNADPGGGGAALLGSLSIAQARIHDGVLADADVLNNYAEGLAALFGGGMLDSQASGNWNDPATWAGNVPGGIPTAFTLAGVGGHTVTLQSGAAAGEALQLGVTASGTVAVGNSQSLSIGQALNVEAGSTMTLGDNALLSAGSGSVSVLGTGVNPTLAVSQTGTLVVDVLSVAGGTVTKQGAGTLRLPGGSPLGAASVLELGGGTVSLADSIGLPGPGPAGALAYWPFDVDAGDTTGNGHDGTMMGTATISAESQRGAGSLELDGTNDTTYVEVPPGFDDDFSGGFSFAVWAKPSAMNNWGRIFDFGNGAAVDCIIFGNRGTSNNTRFGVHDGLDPNTGLPVDGELTIDVDNVFELDTWQHLAGTIDGDGNGVFYKDGQVLGTGNYRVPNSNLRNNNFIGESNWAADAAYAGLMDELYIYSRDLTAAEVATMAGVRTPPDMSGVSVLVTADSTLDLDTAATVSFADLELRSGVLRTTGTAAGVEFTGGTSISAGASLVGADPNVPTDLGVVDGNMADVTFVKAGPGTLTLDKVNQELDNATLEAQGGTFTIVGQAAWGGAHSVRLNGGTFEIVDSAKGPGVGPPGALAHWEFDGDATDNTGNGHDGTIMGGAGFVAGQIGDALEFDGMDDFVQLPPGFDDDYSGGFSFAVWAQPTALMNWGRIFDFGNGAGVDCVLYGNRGTSNNTRLEIWNGVLPGGQITDTDNVWDLNEWQHFAGTIDADRNCVMYKNGEVIDTSTMWIPSSVVRNNNFIGESNWGADASYQGLMDELYIYNRGLTDIEVAVMAGVGTLPDMSHVDVTVVNDSVLNAVSTAPVNFGPLTLNNGIMTAAGALAGMTFTGTTVDAAPDGTVGFDLQVPLQPNEIDVINQTPVTIAKTGPVDLVLTPANVGAHGFGGQVTFEARGGSLVGVHPSGPSDSGPFHFATLGINGGELVLSVAAEGEPPIDEVYYANNLVVDGDGILTAGPGGVGRAGGGGVPLVHLGGSRSHTITLGAGILTARSVGGYALDLAAPISGPGGIDATEGDVSLSASGTFGSLAVSGATANLDASTTIDNVSVSDGSFNVALGMAVNQTMRVTGGEVNAGGDITVQDMAVVDGVVNTGDSQVVVSGSLQLGVPRFSVAAPDTFTAQSDDLLNRGTITLQGGVVSVDTGQAVAVAENLLVNLAADGLPAGAIATWPNDGSLAGDFTAVGAPAVAAVTDGSGVTANAVQFFGGEYFDGPVAPDGLVGVDPTRSIEVWVHNQDIADEETLVSWGRRGGGDGTNMSFNYGDFGTWGAVGHWGWPDIGWGGGDGTNPDPETPPAGEWHHLAYTYDGTTTRVYADGVEKNSEDLGAGTINTHTGFMIRLAAQTAADGVGTEIPGALDIAVVRIHDGVLSGDDVQRNYFAGIVPPSGTDLPNHGIHAAASSTLELAGGMEVEFGDLSIDDGVTLTIDGPGASFNNVSSGQDATIVGTVFVRGNMAPGGSPGILNITGGPAGSNIFAGLEFGDDALYQCEIGQWDSPGGLPPQPPLPNPPDDLPINDRIKITGGDVYLGGTLELTAVSKLHGRVPHPDPPNVEVEWYGDQTRVIASAGGENAVSWTFATVPDPQPESWDNINTGTAEWSQGHIGRGVFLTRQNDGGENDVPGISYGINTTKLHLFQAADGDTNGDRTLGGRDIQNIQSFALFGITEDPGPPFTWPPDWPQGDFDGDGLVTGLDISAILATGLWPTADYAAIDPGEPLDGVVDLLLYPEDVTLEDGTVVPAGTVMIDPDGLTLNGYVLRSAEGIFTGAPAQQLNWFFVEDTDRQISGNMGATIVQVQDLGPVVGPEWTIINPFEKQDVNPFDDLTLTYTVAGTPGTFVGNLIIVPEPSTLAMLLGVVLVMGVLLLRGRRKT